MPLLRELQSTMLGAILDGDYSSAERFIAPSALGAQRRLGVYAHNARANFLGSLESSYPVVLRLVGENCFEQTVRRFQVKVPSRCGDLLPAGAGFAEFLRDSLGLKYAYLGEVARLEWLVQESAMAADAAPLDLTRLAALSVVDYDALHFRLHPSARMFVSPFPCVDIWQAHRDLNRVPEVIDLDHAPCAVVIARARGQLRFHPLTDGELNLLNAFAQDLPFDAAVEAAQDDLQFDATATLLKFVRSEIIVDFS